MSEDRTVEAAIAIEKFIAGLRAEVALLGPAASADLVTEVRDILLDAAREDPERAFAEMRRLGEPSELAATLLAERGIAPAGGIPAASWWRLGIAAVIDMLLGFAAPLAAIWFIAGRILSAGAAGGSALQSTLDIVTLAAATALAAYLAWRAWEPWRIGGRSATAGMALARIAIVRLGGARTVVRNSDLVAAGLESPSLSGPAVAAGVVVVALAALVVWVSVTAVSADARSGAGLVKSVAGSEQMQRTHVLASVDELYKAASTRPPAIAVWPVISEAHLDPSIVERELSDRFKSAIGGGTGYSDMVASEVAPGAWEVSLTEAPGSPSQRDVLLTYTLRVDWSLDKWGTSQPTPVPAWVLTAYEPTP